MIFQALQKVFRKPAYGILALTISAGMFVFATWLPNIRLIVSVATSPDTPLSEKLDLPISLIGSIATNFTLLSASYTIAIAILLGIDLAMVVFYLRRRIKNTKQNGITTGFLGLTTGVLGIGCAACGSLLLTSFLSLIGATGILVTLPLHGGEFGILGLILLGLSIYTVAKQIQNPSVCKI
jgi:hypothetical protein